MYKICLHIVNLQGSRLGCLWMKEKLVQLIAAIEQVFKFVFANIDLTLRWFMASLGVTL